MIPDNILAHFNGSAEYKRYAELLAADPNLSLAYGGSVAYHDSAALLQHGLIATCPAWETA